MSVILRGGNYGMPTMGMSGGHRKKKSMRGGQCSGPTYGGNASPMGMGMSGGGKLMAHSPAQVGGRRRRRTGKVRRHRTKSYRSKGKKTQRRRK